MPYPHLATLLRLLRPLRFAVGYRRSFATRLVLVAGLILTQAPLPCVTEALVATDVTRRRHWQAFHRFFSNPGEPPARSVGPHNGQTRVSDNALAFVLES